LADFHQEGTITIFHDLYKAFDPDEYLINLEEKLLRYSRKVRVSLLLPCLYTELENLDVLDKILKECFAARGISPLPW
jgi:glucosyl-3-phosphoglycerate synthase